MNEEKVRRLRQQESYGGWFAMPRSFFLLFKKRDDAIVLASLVDMARRFKAEEDSDGWFYVKKARLTYELGMDRNIQTVIINRLVKDNFIKKMVKGVPPKRYIWINYDQIELSITKAVFARSKKKEECYENDGN